MRFSPKTFALAVVCLGVAVATGWVWRMVESEALPEPGSEVVSPTEAGPGRQGGAVPEVRDPPVAAVAPASAAGASAAVVRDRAPSPRIALRPPPTAPRPDAEWRRSLAPRAPLPKSPLLSPPGRVHQLTVKLSDRLEARPGPAGELLVTADRADDVAGLARIADTWGLTFRPVQTVAEEALRQLEDRAARRTGRAQPDLGGIVEAVLPDATPERVLAAATALHALAEVEFAEIHSTDAPPPPPSDISPPTPALVSYQSYREPGAGIDVDYVWNTYGIRGAAGLKVIDCEYQYRPTHEDLAGLIALQPGIQSMYTAFGDDHGTAVLGILGAGDNGYGMTGSVPLCELYFYPELSTLTGGGTQSRTATVTAAIAAAEAGDIVVLEMQETGAGGGYGPAEYTSSVWTAVKTGTDAGVIVVAAAGNGAQNLDSSIYQSYRDRGDSGAIIVGAGSQSQARISFSTYGARVNLQGWGGGVATTGYGSLQTYGSDANQKYASGFSGTSSATPIAASAVALLQSVAIEILERRLTPEEVRSVLVATGRAQTGDLSKPIGPLPDLAAAVEDLLASETPPHSTIRSWGFRHFATGTPDLQGDADRNGLSNLMEYVLGTDPLDDSEADAALRPQLLALSGPGGPVIVRFEFNNPVTRTGATWRVESTATLDSPDWQPVEHGVGGVTITRLGDTVRVEIAGPPAVAQRFLQLKVTAP